MAQTDDRTDELWQDYVDRYGKPRFFKEAKWLRRVDPKGVATGTVAVLEAELAEDRWPAPGDCKFQSMKWIAGGILGKIPDIDRATIRCEQFTFDHRPKMLPKSTKVLVFWKTGKTKEEKPALFVDPHHKEYADALKKAADKD